MLALAAIQHLVNCIDLQLIQTVPENLKDTLLLQLSDGDLLKAAAAQHFA